MKKKKRYRKEKHIMGMNGLLMFCYLVGCACTRNVYWEHGPLFCDEWRNVYDTVKTP